MENTSVTTLNSRQECADAVHQVINATDRHIAIFSQQLEPLLYNHHDICDTLSRLARKNKRSDVRIIAQQTKSIGADGHCLIHLAQALSSYVNIRIPKTPELQSFAESWLIADDHSIVQITNPERYEGTMIEHDRLHVRKSLEFFNHAWENSEPDMNTRRLHI